ncbi:MAG: sigma-54-dependent Fis family transcriptional regulator [Desulfobacca sp.]|nr:sigma-54-dependent Fis family transcriptional regulator [Desulfobacca sp.]
MKKKILIVDDEESIRFTFQSFLEKEGLEILTADSYVSAKNILKKITPDVLFVDIVLEGKSGLDLLREVKRRNLPSLVIMITGKPDIDNTAMALRLGAFEYLAKPVRKEDLLRVTQQALRHKSLIDEKDRIEADKEKYRTHLEAVFRSLKDGIIVVNQNLIIQDVNASTQLLCGLEPHRVIDKPIPDVMPSCAQSCQTVIKETIQTGEIIREYRVECRHPEHAHQVVALTCSPLLDLKNTPIGAVLVIRDVTALVDLEKQLKERDHFHAMVGKSQKMQEVYRMIEDLAGQDTTVLITGQSGTGKELVANALHYTGRLAFKPFVKVNCSALVENLLESELFGHVKGAFTGAINTKIGRFEKAHHGTLFLDEIGDISPTIQLKLLRVLQEREFERVGDITPIKVDVRIIASTNCDLKEKINRGKFREDLYYRLKVVEISLPPLKERIEDIAILCDHFIRFFNKRFKKQIQGLSVEAEQCLLDYSWPGNLRELMHSLEHAFVLCHGETILLGHLPKDLREIRNDRILYPLKRDDQESLQIRQALDQTDWNKAKAARLLGISRPTLYRKMQENTLTRMTK